MATADLPEITLILLIILIIAVFLFARRGGRRKGGRPNPGDDSTDPPENPGDGPRKAPDGGTTTVPENPPSPPERDIFSFLERHDLDYLLKAGEKDLENISEEAKQVIEDERKELEALKSIVGRYRRMVYTLAELRKALAEVVDDKSIKTEEENLRSIGIQGGGWSYINSADGKHGYDVQGGGMKHVLKDDMYEIQEDVEKLVEIEEHEEREVKKEIGDLEDEIERFREAYNLYASIKTGIDDYPGSGSEFLKEISQQTVDRGLYSDEEKVYEKLREIVRLGSYLEQGLEEARENIVREEEIGAEIIEAIEENYGITEDLEELWGEETARVLQEHLGELQLEFLEDVGKDTAETIIDRSFEIVELNERVQQQLQNIRKRKQKEEKILQNIERRLASIGIS